MQHDTIRSLASYLQVKEVRPGAKLVSLRPDLQSEVNPLYWVHPGGGNVLSYWRLGQKLDDLPTVAFEAAGLDGVSEPAAGLAEMAADYIQLMREAQTNGPYRLAGWSFGGLVAYEMACQLVEQGEEVERLVIVDSALIYSFAMLRYLFANEAMTLRQLWKMDFEDLLPRFREPALRGNLVASNADDQQLRRTFRVFMANVEAALRFQPRQFNGIIDLIVAKETVACGKHQLTEEWQRTCPRVVTRVVSGDHFSVLQEPHVSAVAEQLREIFGLTSAQVTPYKVKPAA